MQKIIYFLMLLIVGCSSSIPKPPSSMDIPKHTKSGVKIVNSNEDLSRVKWWRKLHDKELNKLINEALRRNYQLKSAEANILVAKSKLNEAHYSWLPTLNAAGYGFVGGGADTNITPQGALARSGIVSQLNTIRFNGYTAGFMPQYSVNILANMQNINYAKASLEVQKATYQSTRLSIISQITGAYFMLLGQKEQLRAEVKLIKDLQKLRQLEWVRYKQGESDLSQVADLDVQIADSKANIPGIENSIAEDSNAISSLLSRYPKNIHSSKDFMQLSVNKLVPARLPSTVLKNRPDVMIAIASLKMAEYKLGIAYSNYFPALSLTSNLGTLGFELSRLLSLSTGLLFLEAGGSIPLLNGVTYEQIKEAKRGYYADFYSYLQTLIAVFTDVDNTLTNLQKANRAYQDKFTSWRNNKKVYKLALARYKAGSTDKRDLIKAQYNVDMAKLNLILAKMQQFDGIVEVYQAVAGGYEEGCV
ncbi:MAG: hypothetical protein A3F18_07180 [Legionellales bacterium RIFCSPHIGHO2_12_FULL_37_14]|nr:MAG: hypothetical protein A3F18_07180 [Legionellales bacterium RIFCSPHIGHO2_12_FULL_37_14]